MEGVRAGEHWIIVKINYFSVHHGSGAHLKAKSILTSLPASHINLESQQEPDIATVGFTLLIPQSNQSMPNILELPVHSTHTHTHTHRQTHSHTVDP